MRPPTSPATDTGHHHPTKQAVGAGIALALAALLYRSVLARLEDPLFTCIFIGVVLVSIVPLLAKALPASGRSRHVHHRGTH